MSYVLGISRFGAKAPRRDDDARPRNADEKRQTFVAAAMTCYRIKAITRAIVDTQFGAVLCLPIPFQTESRSGHDLVCERQLGEGLLQLRTRPHGALARPLSQSQVTVPLLFGRWSLVTQPVFLAKGER